jgi:hypothetical protein
LQKLFARLNKFGVVVPTGIPKDHDYQVYIRLRGKKRATKHNFYPHLKKAQILGRRFESVFPIEFRTHIHPWDKKDNDGDGKVHEANEKVTHGKGGQSPHNYNPSFAIVVAFINNGKTDWSEKWFKAFAPYMSNPKIEWGGIWKFVDYPHFELRGWKSLIKK